MDIDERSSHEALHGPESLALQERLPTPLLSKSIKGSLGKKARFPRMLPGGAGPFFAWKQGLGYHGVLEDA